MNLNIFYIEKTETNVNKDWNLEKKHTLMRHPKSKSVNKIVKYFNILLWEFKEEISKWLLCWKNPIPHTGA